MTEQTAADQSAKTAGRDADELDAALKNLQDAFTRLRGAIEVNAKDEWTRAKPELQTTLGDLQRMIDAAAERAKIALGDLGKRLDPDEPGKVN